MSRWLNSSKFANQIRAQVLAAKSSPAVPQAKAAQQQQAHHVINGPGGRSGLAWTRQAPNKRNASHTGGPNHGSAGAKSDHHNRPSASAAKWRPGPTNNGHKQAGGNNNDNLQPAAQVKLVQGERGPKVRLAHEIFEGACNDSLDAVACTEHCQQLQKQTLTVQNASVGHAKQGERGPKGDRGPSGLISVKDRGALFDLRGSGRATAAELAQRKPDDDGERQLSAADSAGNQSARGHEPRLVFVESEQLLVIETSSGWRPIPLMEPLHDFRRAIAKFSLSGLSADDRAKLKQMNSALEENNMISAPFEQAARQARVSLLARARNSSRTGLGVDNETTLANSISIANTIQAAGSNGGLIGHGLSMENDVDDDEDDDDDEDEEDEDDEDGDEDDEDEDGDEIDDNDDEQAGSNDVGDPNIARVNDLIGSKMDNKIGLIHLAAAGRASAKPKHRRLQVTSRSGLSVAPPATIAEADLSAQAKDDYGATRTTPGGQTSDHQDDNGIGHDESRPASSAMKVSEMPNGRPNLVGCCPGSLRANKLIN
jgi:hypothetical protein